MNAAMRAVLGIAEEGSREPLFRFVPWEQQGYLLRQMKTVLEQGGMQPLCHFILGSDRKRRSVCGMLTASGQENEVCMVYAQDAAPMEESLAASKEALLRQLREHDELILEKDSATDTLVCLHNGPLSGLELPVGLSMKAGDTIPLLAERWAEPEDKAALTLAMTEEEPELFRFHVEYGGATYLMEAQTIRLSPWKQLFCFRNTEKQLRIQALTERDKTLRKIYEHMQQVSAQLSLGTLVFRFDT